MPTSNDDNSDQPPTMAAGDDDGDATTVVPPPAQPAPDLAWSTEEIQRQSWGPTWGRAAVLLACTSVVALAVGFGGWALVRMHHSAAAPYAVTSTPTSQGAVAASSRCFLTSRSMMFTLCECPASDPSNAQAMHQAMYGPHRTNLREVFRPGRPQGTARKLATLFRRSFTSAIRGGLPVDRPLPQRRKRFEVLYGEHFGRPDLDPTSLLPHAWKGALASGLLAILLGVLILAWPGISILVASVLFGVYLLVIGCTQVFSAFSLPVSTGSRILLFIGGTASLIVAVLTFRHFGQAYAVLLLAIWIGIGFIFRGVATTVAAISHASLPGRGWQILFGLISVIAGIIMLAAPFPSIVTLAIVVGVSLIVLGVFEMVAAFRMRGDVTRIPVKTRSPSTA